MSSCFVVTCVRKAVHFSCFGVDAINLVALWIAPVLIRGRGRLCTSAVHDKERNDDADYEVIMVALCSGITKTLADKCVWARRRTVELWGVGDVDGYRCVGTVFGVMMGQ